MGTASGPVNEGEQMGKRYVEEGESVSDTSWIRSGEEKSRIQFAVFPYMNSFTECLQNLGFQET